MVLYKRFCLIAAILTASCSNSIVAQSKATSQPSVIVTQLGPVTPKTADIVISAIEKGNKEHKPVIVAIDSFGGSVYSGWKIIKAMKMSEVPVICIVDGNAQSMAAVILQACDVRGATPWSVIMYHKPSLSLERAQENELKAQTQALHVIWFAMSEFVAHRIKMDPDLFRLMCENECSLTAKEALEFKMIDHLVIPEN